MANYSRESEQEAIGAALASNDIAVELVSQLRVDHFYIKETKIIYLAIEALVEKGIQITTSSVISYLREINESNVKPEYVNKLAKNVIALSAAPFHMEQIINKFNLRRLHEMIQGLYQTLDTTNDDASAIAEDFKQKLEAISLEKNGGDAFASSSEIFGDIYTNLDELRTGKRTNEGVKSGFPALDSITNGFQPGNLVILAARPSMGKTALALNFAANASKDDDGATVFFSLEMAARELAVRIISNESRVENEKLTTGKGITNSDWTKITSVIAKLKKRNLYFNDQAGITLSQIQTKLRKLASTTKIKMVILDYLQILTPGSERSSRETQVSKISRGFKLIARDLNVPFIALAQLSRAVEKRENKRPILSDLRESGAIEQDADIIMFLHREQYYDADKSKANESSVAQLIIAKHRNGALGTVELAFAAKLGSFVSIDA